MTLHDITRLFDLGAVDAHDEERQLALHRRREHERRQRRAALALAALAAAGRGRGGGGARGLARGGLLGLEVVLLGAVVRPDERDGEQQVALRVMYTVQCNALHDTT